MPWSSVAVCSASRPPFFVRVRRAQQFEPVEGDLADDADADDEDAADNDETYQRMANVFIEYEEQMVEDPEHIKQHYNNSVKLCISCHQLKCTGPIPRIKKLLIN